MHLRHKSVKTSFRLVFFMMAVLNRAVLAFLISGMIAGDCFLSHTRYPPIDSPSPFLVRRRFDILVFVMLRQSLTDLILATNTEGSGKAASCVRAFDMFGPILAKHDPKPIVGGSTWHDFSFADIYALYEWMSADDRKKLKSYRQQLVGKGKR